MNIVKHNEKVYSKLAKRYESYAEEKRKLSKPIMKRLSRYIKSGNEFLDIGCAVGLHMKLFEELGFNVTGIDVSKEMADFAKKRNPKAKIIIGDFMKLKIKKEYDGILAQAFIHLYPKGKVEKVLEKMYSILNEGGVLFITTSKSKESKEGYFSKRDCTKTLKRYRKYFTKKELHDALSKKFKVIDYFEKKNHLGEQWMIFVAKK